MRLLSLLGLSLMWAAFAAPIRAYDFEPIDDLRLTDAGLEGVATYGPLVVAATLLLGYRWTRGRRARARLGWSGWGLVMVCGAAVAVLAWFGADAMVIWEGVDEQGRATGGSEEPSPSWGMGLGIIGAFVLCAAEAIPPILAGWRSRSPSSPCSPSS